MDDLERTITEMLERVNQFGTENAPAVVGNPKAVSCFAAVQAAVNELESRGIIRTSAGGAKLNASEQRALNRHSIISILSRIAKTARDISRNDDTFDNKFRTPQTNKSDLSWLETARAFAAGLPPVRQEFIDYGHDADFIDKLVAAANDFEASMNEQNSYLRQRVDSNASIDSILDEALKAVRTLKIIIPNIFSGNPGKLADWTSAAHLERRASKSKPPAAPTS